MDRPDLANLLASGDLDARIQEVYAVRPDQLAAVRDRLADLARAHAEAFPGIPAGLFIAFGRTEMGGNHTDRLAHIDKITTAQITPIALGTQPVTGITGQRRANHDFVDPELVDKIAELFTHQRASFNDGLIGFRINQVEKRYTTQNSFAQGLDHFATFK